MRALNQSLKADVPVQQHLSSGSFPIFAIIRFNAVASSPRVHGEGTRDSSERSLDRPGSQCSIGILPVFFRTIERRFRDSSKSLCALHARGRIIYSDS